MCGGNKISGKFPDCFRPPLVNINAYNIKLSYAGCFTDYDLQQELIINGRKYVEENNNSLTVVKNMINNLNNPRHMITVFKINTVNSYNLWYSLL